MRHSLQGMVTFTLVMLMTLAVLQSVLSIIAIKGSVDQVTTLERHGLEPAVGLSILSQDLDQERALLSLATARATADEARALRDELTSLDISITGTAPRIIAPTSLGSWLAAWAAYQHARTPYMAQAMSRTIPGGRMALLQPVYDRLDAVMDIGQSNAGSQLYTGENLYRQALTKDWQAVALALLALAVTLLTGGILATRISQRLARGLGNLAATADLVAQGSVAARADEQGSDEIARVAAAFNQMKDALLSAELRAGTDALTGLPNHRTTIAAIDRECERAQRFDRPWSILFFDLDHFKALNDGFGHPAGDGVLRDFAEVVRRSLKGVDLLGRWGGEEFVALLPEAGPEGAVAAAERARAAVAAHPFMAGSGAHITCSIGVASYPGDGSDRNALVAAADRAMYAAKRLGRNQTRAAGDPAVAALDTVANREGGREEVALAGTIEALAALADTRDHATARHSQEVATLVFRLAQELGLDEAEARLVMLAARLHDVGKVAIPDAILFKPGKLTEEDWLVMRTHPVVGAEVVGLVPALRPVVPLIRAHHEQWDGQGYPDGTAGEAILLGARIIAAADAYCAMITDRPYRRARKPTMAVAELRRCAGRQFDPAVIEALERVIRDQDTQGEPQTVYSANSPIMVTAE